jgi:hypothetical protein
MSQQNTKWPRHYAAEIIALPSRDDHAAALQRVPEHIRAWVRELVEDLFFRRDGKRASNTPPEALRRDPSAGAVKTPAAPAGHTVGSRAIAGMRSALA